MLRFMGIVNTDNFVNYLKCFKPIFPLQYWRRAKMEWGGILVSSIPLPSPPKYWTKKRNIIEIPPLLSPPLPFFLLQQNIILGIPNYNYYTTASSE